MSFEPGRPQEVFRPFYWHGVDPTAYPEATSIHGAHGGPVPTASRFGCRLPLRRVSRIGPRS